MEAFLTVEGLIAFFTLCALELVLGIDNIIFISILSAKLPHELQQRARTTGLALAIVTRVLLLLSLSWVISLTEPLLSIFSKELSGRDLILLLGGFFLIAKSTVEIHNKLEAHEASQTTKPKNSLAGVVFQILVLDIVFSLDSVITAVGMVNNIAIMIAAVVVSAVVMIFTATPISNFVDRHPTIKILALSFLLMIGITLMAEALDHTIPKGYIYFGMTFSLFVELLNIQMRKKADPIQLRKHW